MKAKWIIDNYFKDDSGYDLEQVIKECGYDVTIIDYHKALSSESRYPYDLNDIVIPRTTIAAQRLFTQYFGSYYSDKDFQFSNYYSLLNIDKSLWLNNDFILTTWNDLQSNYKKYKRLLNSESFFIRPNSGSKAFTGFVIQDHNHFVEEINFINQTSKLSPESLLVLSSVKNINEEYRFIICDNEIIDGSQYGWDENEKYAVQHFYPHEAYELANIVANADGKPSSIFVCDIAKVNEIFQVIELNCFNCSGWYKCDPYKIITKVSDFVEKQYKEIYE